jgi:hypothetical protein
MAAEAPIREAAGSAMARWSAKALLITAGVLLVGGAIWYARSATVPLIVAALVSTQLLPLVVWATGRTTTTGSSSTRAIYATFSRASCRPPRPPPTGC